jgi:hypothetical protein
MIIDLFRVGTVGLMAIPSLPFAALCVLLFCTVLTGVPFSSARAALMPDVLPGDTFVLGSAIGNITYQASQILGFVAGAAVVAVLDPHKTLGIDAVTFGLSALILLTGVRSRPAPSRAGAARASLWSVSADGVRIVFGSRLLLTLLLFGWLAGFYIVPEGLAAPYALPARQRADRGTADGGRAPRHGDRRLRDQQDRHPVRADQDDGLARRPVLRPTPGPARSAGPSPACTPSRASASWPAARWRSWSAPRSPSAWPAWSA